MIYFDNAATTMLKPKTVIQSVADAMMHLGNCGRGTHDSGLSAARIVYETRVKIAELFGCKRADHVVFTSNVTEALNIAIQGIIEPGDHVITTDLEHNSVLRPLYALRDNAGVELSFVSADEMGRPRYEEFESLIKPDTRAIVCTHASNITGNIVDIKRVGEIAKKNGLLLIVDAAQTAGAVPIDMEELGIDVLCFTGHKGLMGPQGTGGLCIREGVEIRPFKYGGTGVKSYLESQPEEYPTRLEAGTLNAHGISGLSAAIDYINNVGIDTIAAQETMLMKRFYEVVKDIPGIKIYGDFGTDQTQLPDRCAIVTLNMGEYEAGQVSDCLSYDYGIATRPGAHCAPRMHRSLGTEQQGAVRFSFGWFNTTDEIDEAIKALKEIQQDQY